MMNRYGFRIKDRLIGLDHSPFVIAEMSGNHNQSLERALAIVEAAAKSGVHAVKLQTYTADTMTIDMCENEFLIEDTQSLWCGCSLYELYKRAHTPWVWHEIIFKRCEKLGLICFSTPFDETAVDYLESLDCPCYKIASFENIDLPLIRKVASTGKPIIISTGMATVAELDEAVRAARGHGARQIILLKCTSTYPASPEDSNLMTLPHMRQLFCCEIGISDHTIGIGASIASIALGATVIEKHFTLSRTDGGVDAAFSLEPDEMATLVEESKRAWQALGRVSYEMSERERRSLIYRRSLYIVKDMKSGDVLTRDNLRAIRPGLGMPPKYIDIVLGRRIMWDARRGTPLTWEIVG